MRVIRSPEPLSLGPRERSVFLGGTIDMGDSGDWQQALVDALTASSGTLLNPRREHWSAGDGSDAENPRFRAQVAWELAAMEAASLIAFYFAPTSLAPITLLELGLAARSGKALVCCPRGYWRRGNVVAVCEHHGVPMVDSLDGRVVAVRAFCQKVLAVH